MSKKLTTEQFISKARKIHGDKYDYSEVDYINALVKIKIICPEHGEFWQVPNTHCGIYGCGCPKCAQISFRLNRSLTTEQFISKARKIHGDKYDYSKVDYVTNETKVKIICSEHGEFWQVPNSHIDGKSGCPQCGIISRSRKQSYSLEQFIEKAKKVHRDKYDYSKVEYDRWWTKVKIICPEHGEFIQSSNNHLHGRGCPSCALTFSKPEEELRQFIQGLIPSAYKTSRGEIIPKQELDVFIPSRKIAFEFQGEYWHKHHHVDVEERDERKRQSCQKLGIQLYEIWENDWNNHKEETKQKIREIIFGFPT
jgi:DNA G:T-mismatch repair endonuclease